MVVGVEEELVFWCREKGGGEGKGRVENVVIWGGLV